MHTTTWTTGHSIVDIRRELARLPEITEAEARRMVELLNAEHAKHSPSPVGTRVPESPIVSAALNGLR